MIRRTHQRVFSVVCAMRAAGANLAAAHPVWHSRTLSDSIQQTVESRQQQTRLTTAAAARAVTRARKIPKRWEVRLRDSKQRTLVVVIEAKSSSHARKVAKAQFPAYRIGSVREIKPN